MFEFCKRPTFFDFWLNPKARKADRAASKGKRLFKMALGTLPIDYLSSHKEYMPAPF